MIDLVETLKAALTRPWVMCNQLIDETIAEITRLRAEVERLTRENSELQSKVKAAEDYDERYD